MEDLGDEAKRRQMEYTTQFFGYTPDSLVDTLLGDASDIVGVNLRAARKHIQDKFWDKVEPSELEESFKTLQERYVESVEGIYFKFGRYLKENILLVPAHVLLPEDKPHKAHPDVDGSDLKAKREKFDILCQYVKDAKVQKAELIKTRDDLLKIKERQQALVKRTRVLKEQIKVEAAFEKEREKLEKKVETLRTVMQSIENNLPSPTTNGKESNQAVKRDFEPESGVHAKRLKKDD